MKFISEQTYVDDAEKVILKLSNKTDQRGRKVEMVSTSKIRNILSMTADIYNNVLVLQDDSLTDELNGRISYLRMRIIYDCGREPKVKDFITEAKILEALKEINGSKANYILFNHYMEALIAFHKFYDGRD